MAYERWKDVMVPERGKLVPAPGYRISSFGRLKSYLARGGVFRIKPTGVILKANGSAHSYVQYCLRVGGSNERRYYACLGHSLVLWAFVGLRPSLRHECRHLDGNPRNNYLTNLEWGTRQENVADRMRHGTGARGVSSGRTKLTEEQVIQIRERASSGEIQASLARAFGINSSTVSLILAGDRWKHVGGPRMPIRRSAWVTFRCSPEWQEWLKQAAEYQESSVSDFLSRAAKYYAKKIKFPEEGTPKR